MKFMFKYFSQNHINQVWTSWWCYKKGYNVIKRILSGPKWWTRWLTIHPTTPRVQPVQQPWNIFFIWSSIVVQKDTSVSHAVTLAVQHNKYFNFWYFWSIFLLLKLKFESRTRTFTLCYCYFNFWILLLTLININVLRKIHFIVQSRLNWPWINCLLCCCLSALTW